mmetsp:Transcript_40780/g.68327  ORF Transcript_40780/g.68327 Transcript_40780/m.68327 type:complete len:217 (-) Transcript_40780:325-975(-)
MSVLFGEAPHRRDVPRRPPGAVAQTRGRRPSGESDSLCRRPSGGNHGDFTSMDSLASMPFNNFRHHVELTQTSIGDSISFQTPCYDVARRYPAAASRRSPMPSHEVSHHGRSRVPSQLRPQTPQDSYEELVALDENNVRRGVSESVIRRLPRTKMGRTTNQACTDIAMDCRVCMDKFAAGSNAMKLPCGHVFHEDCIRPWFSENRTCPVCRHEVQK